MSTEEIAKVMDTYTKNQNASYENNLKTLGAIDLDKPSSISIYPKTFCNILPNFNIFLPLPFLML